MDFSFCCYQKQFISEPLKPLDNCRAFNTASAVFRRGFPNPVKTGFIATTSTPRA